MAEPNPLVVKIGVLRAKVKAIIFTNPYNPIASEATEPELQTLVNNLEAAIAALAA